MNDIPSLLSNMFVTWKRLKMSWHISQTQEQWESVCKLNWITNADLKVRLMSMFEGQSVV